MGRGDTISLHAWRRVAFRFCWGMLWYHKRVRRIVTCHFAIKRLGVCACLFGVPGCERLLALFVPARFLLIEPLRQCVQNPP